MWHVQGFKLSNVRKLTVEIPVADDSPASASTLPYQVLNQTCVVISDCEVGQPRVLAVPGSLLGGTLAKGIAARCIKIYNIGLWQC